MADKVLIVDDDEDLRGELRDLLEGYETIEASSGEEALKLLGKAHEVGLVILDVMMPGINGLDALTEIKKKDPSLRIIILTGHSSKDVAIEALKNRADDYLEKPLDVNKIKLAVEKMIGEARGENDIGSLDLKGKVERVKKFIERNCCKKTGLNEAASAVCLSPKYLSRVFKQYCRTGFNGYKLKIKMQKAAELLNKSSLNINQISDKLGYENVESFIRQFKKFSRLTPSAFRAKSLKKKPSRRR